LLFPSVYSANRDKVRTFPQFLADCRDGTLPSVSIVSPGVNSYTEENPGDIQLGEAYSASIINALMQSPAWESTVLFFMYDEHGGYYDHVPPPPAIKPDNIRPGADSPGITGAYDRYGFRVPTVIVSPFAKRDYVSHLVHDHTSVLKLIETKWNLPALTYRDANASDLLDSLDLEGPPAFAEPPKLAAPGKLGTCTPGNAGGAIPPPSAIVPKSEAASLRIGATA
jgi:phospholipase C